MDTWTLGHRPALHGLRGIAVLLVVATHFDRGQVTLGGVMGVKMFFALSGFLITTLLLQEHDKTGGLSFRRFYARRTLRLLPALVLVASTAVLLTAADFPTELRPSMVLAVGLYGSNWYLLATSTEGVIHWNMLSHTWSLAIEEQFYVLWPLLVYGVARLSRPWLLPFTVGGAAGSLIWWLSTRRPDMASDISAWCLLVGCALAAWMHGRPARRPRPWLAVAPLVALAPLVFLHDRGSAELAHVAAPLATTLTIWVAVQSRVRPLEARWLVWVGQRSYGLYLWHYPVAHLCVRTTAPWLVSSSIGLLVSFGLAELSWRFVETPFLRLKDRRTRSSGTRSDLPARPYGPTSPRNAPADAARAPSAVTSLRTS